MRRIRRNGLLRPRQAEVSHTALPTKLGGRWRNYSQHTHRILRSKRKYCWGRLSCDGRLHAHRDAGEPILSYRPISFRNGSSASSSARGLSPWIVWPAFSIRCQRPLGTDSENSLALSSVSTSLRAPRSTRVGQTIFCALSMHGLALVTFVLEVLRHPVGIVFPGPSTVGLLAQIVEQAAAEQLAIAHRIELQCAFDKVLNRIHFAIHLDEIARFSEPCMLISGAISTNTRPAMLAAWRMA